MEIKETKRTYALSVNYFDGTHESFFFSDFVECVHKRSELLDCENVKTVTYTKTCVMSKSEKPFDKEVELERLRNSFSNLCHNVDCDSCRYNKVSNCELAFFVDHYTKDGDNNEN